jgi:hypothetical protein
MKTSSSILAVAFALFCFGCGGSDVATTAAGKPDPDFPVVSSGDDPRFATISGGQGQAQPEVDPPDRRPPGSLLIRDLEVGSGPVARPGDRVAVRYLGVIYKTGEVYYRGWLYPPALRIRLRPDGQAWEEGIWGMREGGRRELVVPSRLAFGKGAIDYVIELVRVEPAAKPPPGGDQL